MSDSWLSYSKNGKKVYLNALLFNINLIPNSPSQAIAVSTSKNNGATWSVPKYLITNDNYFNEPTGQFPFEDKNSITANPNNAKFVYSVWDHFYQTVSFHSDTFFARSLDGGKTWFPAVPIYDGTHQLQVTGLSNGVYNDNNTIVNEIIVLPKKDCCDDPRLTGELLNFFVRVYAKPTATDDQYTNDSFPFQFTSQDIALIRSKDNGVTWTRNAHVIANLPINNLYRWIYL